MPAFLYGLEPGAYTANRSSPSAFALLGTRGHGGRSISCDNLSATFHQPQRALGRSNGLRHAGRSPVQLCFGGHNRGDGWKAVQGLAAFALVQLCFASEHCIVTMILPLLAKMWSQR